MSRASAVYVVLRKLSVVLLVHNALAAYVLKYISNSCRLMATNCNVDTHANNLALFMAVLCPQLCVHMDCSLDVTIQLYCDKQGPVYYTVGTVFESHRGHHTPHTPHYTHRHGKSFNPFMDNC